MEDNEKTLVKEEEVAKALPKKSELIDEQKRLYEQYNKGIEELLNKEFSVNVVNKSQFDKLCKFVEKEIKVDNSSAANVLMLHSNLKQQKPYTKKDDWNGHIMMNTTSCKALWNGFMNWEGKGVFEATSFLGLVQLVGPEISKNIKTINENITPLNGLHTRLAEIDNILDSGEFEDDMPEEETKLVTKEEEKNLEEIENEVNPENV